MFKLGVYREEQYGRSSAWTAWLRKNRVSYQLLRTSPQPSAAEIARFEYLSQQILMPSGVYRMTKPDRFRELDRFLNGILERHFGQRPLELHDWAASDCSTSAAWYEVLAAKFPQAVLTASDLNLYLTEAQLPDGDTYIFDSNGAPLQYIRPPFVIRISPPEPKFLFGNRFLQNRAQAKLAELRTLGKLNVAEVDFNSSDEVRRPPYIFRRIPLVHPVAEALRLSKPAFRILRHSVFDPLSGSVDVIRTMNILNVSYFDKDRLNLAAGNIWRSLRPSGLWIVGRTIREDPPCHHTSVLLRTQSGFEVFERHTEKSEIEDLALALRVAA